MSQSQKVCENCPIVVFARASAQEARLASDNPFSRQSCLHHAWEMLEGHLTARTDWRQAVVDALRCYELPVHFASSRVTLLHQKNHEDLVEAGMYCFLQG